MTYLGLCRIKCFTGKPDEAEKYLKITEKLDPDSLNKDIHKAGLLEIRGEKSEALALLKKCLPRKFLGEADAYDVDMKMAEVLFSMGKRDEGFIYLKRVFEKDYPSAGLIRLRFVIPKSKVFMKLKDDSEINGFLINQKEKIFRVYKEGGVAPDELNY